MPGGTYDFAGERPLDSRDHRVPSTRTDPFTAEGVSKTDGKVDYTFCRTVSKDGKMERP
jgi:hypothetical protein